MNCVMCVADVIRRSLRVTVNDGACSQARSRDLLGISFNVIISLHVVT